LTEISLLMLGGHNYTPLEFNLRSITQTYGKYCGMLSAMMN